MNKIFYLPLLLLLTFVLYGCATNQKVSDADQDSALAAVMNYELERMPKESESYPYKEVFLQVEGRDPSPNLLSMLRGSKRPILPASEADRRSQGIDEIGIRNRQTGARGVMVSYGKLQWKKGTVLRFNWSEYMGGFKGGGGRGEVALENSAWVVRGFSTTTLF